MNTRYRELEVLLPKTTTRLPKTFPCPACSATTKAPQFRCDVCASHIVFIEETPLIVLND